jgi:predicted RNase H-like nuclease (RuvC/YqgF family)
MEFFAVAFCEQQDRRIENLEGTIVKLGSALAEQKRQVEALTVGLAKVSAELELRKAAPQIVLNN